MPSSGSFRLSSASGLPAGPIREEDSVLVTNQRLVFRPPHELLMVIVGEPRPFFFFLRLSSLLSDVCILLLFAGLRGPHGFSKSFSFSPTGSGLTIPQCLPSSLYYTRASHFVEKHFHMPMKFNSCLNVKMPFGVRPLKFQK